MDIEILNKIIEKVQKIKVLYVEDNKDVREQTLKIFEDFFGDIHVSKNGLEGLELFKLVSDFDLVITDISMPIMSGINMSKSIREIDSEVAIIIISAHNENSFLDEVKEYNINQYIFKPLNLDSFVGALQKIYLK